MEQNEPLVSIVLPVYNASKYLKTSLESLVSQSYGNLEIIIIDDASTDNSYRILSSYRKKNSRIKIFRNKKHYGLAICLNRAMKRVKGNLVTFMDPRDISTQNRIERQVAFLFSHPKIAAVGTQCLHIDNNNKSLSESIFPLEHESIQQTVYAGLSMQFETALINRLLLPKDILKFKTNKYPLTFTQVFMRIVQYGTVANMADVLYYRRTSALTLIGKSKLQHVSNILKLWVQAQTHSRFSPSVRSLFVPLTKLL